MATSNASLQARPTSGAMQSCLVCTVPVDRISYRDVVALVMDRLKSPQPMQPLRVFGLNTQIVTLACSNRHFHQALTSAEIRVSDGISMVLASRVLGAPVPERIPCGELMESLCAECAKSGHSVFFLGGLPGAADKAAAVLQEKYAGLKVAGTLCPPYLFDKDPVESSKVIEQIKSAAPDLLFVAFGAPRQELWIHKNSLHLPIQVALPVGAAFDTASGLRKRAPKWAQRTGNEWLYRLVMEPRRLWRRYLLGNAYFVFLVIRQKLGWS